MQFTLTLVACIIGLAAGFATGSEALARASLFIGLVAVMAGVMRLFTRK